MDRREVRPAPHLVLLEDLHHRGAGPIAIQAKRSKTPVGVRAIQDVHDAKAHYRSRRARSDEMPGY